MQSIFSVFSTTLPFFTLIFCGYVATRRGFLPVQALPGFNAFVLYFALPCMLLELAAHTAIGLLFDYRVLAVYLPCACLMVFGIVAAGRRSGRGWCDAALGALATTMPNSGFIGIPLLVALMGTAVSGPVILTILIDSVFTMTICLAMSRLDASSSLSPSYTLRQVWQGLKNNPIAWSVLLGALISFTQIRLPVPLERTIGLLGAAAAPVSLFVFGGILAQTRTKAVPDEGISGRMARDDAIRLALVKLLVHPMLMLLVGGLATHFGLLLPPETLCLLAMIASLPAGSVAAMFAERMGADAQRLSRIGLASTLLSFFTFAGFFTWLSQ